MAFLTRSESIRPLAARLLMSAALLAPELRHAIVLAPRTAALPMNPTVLIKHNVMMIVMRVEEELACDAHGNRDSGSVWFCGDAVV